MEMDWQNSFSKINDGFRYIMNSKKLVDCQFLVGTSPNQSLISGHRLILAMASPVFERMLYGSLKEKDGAIIVPDTQPEIFQAMIEYMYTDEISILSLDNAYDLFYLAKKYMVLRLVKLCINFLLTELTPNYACRVYELGKLFEEQRLMVGSMEHIAFNTREVITDPSFMDVEVSTLVDILDQNNLNIQSENDLFDCLLKYANEHDLLNDNDTNNTSVVDGSENVSDAVVEGNLLELENSNSGPDSISAGTCGNAPNVADKLVKVDSDASESEKSSDLAASMINLRVAQRTTKDEDIFRQAVKKIRFLTYTVEQFAEGPAKSKLLKQSEAAIIFNIISKNYWKGSEGFIHLFKQKEAIEILKMFSKSTSKDSLPEGFSNLGKRDRVEGRQFTQYCVSQPLMLTGKQKSYHSTELKTCLTFKVDKNIYLVGVQLKSKTTVSLKPRVGSGESCTVHIENMQGSKIGDCTSRRIYSGCYEFYFQSPVFIYRNQNYKIIVHDRRDLKFLMHSWEHDMVCENVKFTGIPQNPDDKKFASIICSFLFSY